jgi:hypothetical protein
LSRARLAQLAGVLSAALAFACSAPAALACAKGYTYAGVYAQQPAPGVAASISMLSMPSVDGGHVAAWVGIGGAGLGPGGTDEWLQVGLASFDTPDARLYYELAVPGKSPHFFQLGRGILPGFVVRVAVMELPYSPNYWVVVTPNGIAGPFFLPRSHNRWEPVATAESWAKGGRLCNRYAYRFQNVQVAERHGSWRPLRNSISLQDPGWKVQRSSGSAFNAASDG